MGTCVGSSSIYRLEGGAGDADPERWLGVMVGLCGSSLSIVSVVPVSSIKIQPGSLPKLLTEHSGPSVQMSNSRCQGPRQL